MPCLSSRCLAVVLVFLNFTAGVLAAPASDDKAVLSDLTADITRLAPQTIHVATGKIPHDYLIPAGYYQQIWDWDSFFIGAHWANQNAADARYLQWWVLNAAGFVDDAGYASGCITPKGPVEVHGSRFSMKPFLAQGAYLASERLHDFTWIAPVWDTMERVIAYREKTQFDAKWGLYFWENGLQSGADNNVALTNDPKDPSAILAVDASVFMLREHLAMAAIADEIHHPDAAAEHRRKAAALKQAILKNLWSAEDVMFWNRRRDTGAWIKRMSYSNFTPLTEDLLSRDEARLMITRHLLNPEEMRSTYGFRSLSKRDPDYNNRAIIDPYSNWQGPIWVNANYLHWIALRRYGFPAEAHWTAVTIAAMLHRDIAKWGSMHEDYNAETGEGLAPTPEQSHSGKFDGFVGWNMLALDMLQCAVQQQNCMLLAIPASGGKP